MPHALNRRHLLALSTRASPPAWAQTPRPTRPVRTVVPFALAGSIDLLAPSSLPPAQVAALIGSETAKWARVVKASAVRVD